MNLAIDAHNIKSGGGQKYIIKILENYTKKYNFDNIFIWGHSFLLNQIPNNLVIKKKILKRTKFIPQKISDIFWHIFVFKKEVENYNCNYVFFPGGINLTFLKRKTYTTILNMEPFFKNKNDSSIFNFKKRIRLLLLKYALLKSIDQSTGIIFLNKYLKVFFKKNYNINKKNTISLLGINILKIKKIQKKISLYNLKKPFIIAYVSTIFSYKNHLKTIGAIKKIIKDGLPIKFYIIGDSHDLNLENQIKVSIKNFKQIKYVGYLTNQKLKSFYRKINLKIFSSSCEAFPNIMLEAANYEIPIACSNKQPMPSIFGENCIYFNPNNENDIYLKLKKLIINRKLREKNSRLCKKTLIKKYQWENCAKKIFTFISG